MIIAQISDLHLRTDGEPLRGGIDPAANLDACLDHIRAMTPRPDVVLATGDLVQKQCHGDYGALRARLDALGIPTYVIPGNHDRREPLRAAFADAGYFTDPKFCHYVVEGYPLRLIALDTVIDGGDGGKMGPGRRAWLADRLAEAPDAPTLIFMHHPPFKVGIDFMDRPDFIGAAELDALVRRHPRVERVVCGHAHRPMTVRWGGTVATVAPSLVFQMAMDMRPGARSSFVLEPPGFAVYAWRPDTGLVGHVHPVGDFGPRQAFRMAAAAPAAG
ncbi:MAG: phosphodiesterase [Hyphomicrobiales bacterium]|nr:phosphodiesterase [Hyphomicrobiales bacterium]